MTAQQLFAAIERTLPSLAGWCELPKANDLAATALALRPNVVVEIGVFGGRSLIPMALACECLGAGRVYAIDPWSPVASSEGYDGKNKEWWGNLDHEQVFSGFVTALVANGVRDRVEILRKKSDEVEPPPVIDLLHIDGQHTEQAVRDVERFASRVRVAGYCFTDDDDWSHGGPQAAVARLLTMGFVPLYKCGTGTAFQRVR